MTTRKDLPESEFNENFEAPAPVSKFAKIVIASILGVGLLAAAATTNHKASAGCCSPPPECPPVCAK